MSLHPLRHAGLAAILCLAAHAQAASNTDVFVVILPVVSAFDSGSEGWLVSDIAAVPGAGTAATWDSALQRIATSDIVSWTTFSAPASFLSNRSVYYGGSFSFDLGDNNKDANADTVATFGIASGATALYWFGGAPSTTTLTHFTAGLSETDTRWRIGGLPTDINSGSVPTAAQFQGVLGALTAIRINADWTTSFNDIAALDNVVMAAVPEPSAGWLLLAGLPFVSRRRRGA